MLDMMISQLEIHLHTALIELVATARTQLEGALAEIDKERAKAIAGVDARRTELERDMEAMHTHKEQQEGRVALNVGGYRLDIGADIATRARHLLLRRLLQRPVHAACVR
jgi:hypothetical protein